MSVIGIGVRLWTGVLKPKVVASGLRVKASEPGAEHLIVGLF